jgi:hypothetical protein
MALAKLYTLGRPFIITRTQQLLDLWTSVLESLANEAGTSTYPQSVDSLVYPRQEGPYVATAGQSAGEARKSALQATDPVHNVVLKEIVGHCLGMVVQKFGGAEEFQREVLDNVDRSVVEQFGNLGVL